MLKERLEIEKIMEARFEDGQEEGREEGKLETLLGLYQDGFISKEIVLEKLNMSEEKLETLMKKYQ